MVWGILLSKVSSAYQYRWTIVTKFIVSRYALLEFFMWVGGINVISKDISML